MAEVVAFDQRAGGGHAELDRTPPQDLAAEMSVLGAMLMSKDAVSDVVEIVRGTDFYRPAHEFIFEAIVNLYGRGEPADPVTVAAELTKRGELSRVGGAVYLHDLLASVSIAANASYYATIVRDKAVLRRLVNASIRISQLGYAGMGDVDAIVDEAQQTLFEVTENKQNEDYKPLSLLVQPTMDEMEAIARNDAIAGVPTGISQLDAMTNGLHPGQMVIVAARPGVGKSTLALDFCRSSALQNDLCAAFFSLEMSQTEIVMKLVSAQAGVSLKNIRSGSMNDMEWDKVTQELGKMSEKPFYIDDSPNLTMMEIRSKARRLKQRHDLKLIVIDYIQLMSSGKKVESRQLEVSEFSRQIKLLAKELEVPVVALSQLNRGPEQRKDGVPQLSDLRESGSLEQDADIVILLHREELYNQNEPSVKGLADLHIAKHRNGELGKVECVFQGHYSRFVDAG